MKAKQKRKSPLTFADLAVCPACGELVRRDAGNFPELLTLNERIAALTTEGTAKKLLTRLMEGIPKETLKKLKHELRKR